MDWNNVGAQAILALVPIVTMVVVYGVRRAVPKLPRFSIPILAMALGFILTYVQNEMGGPAVTPLTAAILGASATWLREIISTIREHGTNP